MLNKQQKAKMVQNSEKAETFLKLLANKHRLQILCTLTEGEMCAGAIENLTELSQSALSQHLAKLRVAGVLESEKRGQMVYYKIASAEVNAMLSVLYLIYCNE